MEKARIFAFCLVCCWPRRLLPARQPQNASRAGGCRRGRPAAGAPALPAGVTPPTGYVIGPDDQLSIVYWREKDMSADVVVRPDGLISLPLLNDVQASGPDARAAARRPSRKGATKFVEEPTVSVVVKAINSRKVFITGQVGKPGPYPLGRPDDRAAADRDRRRRRRVRRQEQDHDRPQGERQGRQLCRFNYEDVMKGKNLAQNIELKPGDTVIVP